MINVNIEQVDIDVKLGGTTGISGRTRLAGKNILMLGDSIIGNDRTDGVPDFVASYTGAAVYNGGIGGTRLSVRNDGSPTACLDAPNIINALVSGDWSEQEKRAAELAENGGNFAYFPKAIETLKKVDMKSIDILALAYGTNDWRNAHTQEQILSALKTIIDTVQKNFPLVRILVITPIYRYFGESDKSGDSDTVTSLSDGTVIGYTLKELATLIETTAKDKRISVLNAYQELQLSRNNATTYFDEGDKTHLNSLGNQMYAHIISGKLFSMFASTSTRGPKGPKGDSGGPKGDPGGKGDTGKTAYEYAKDGGYTGTEEEFSEKLAKDNVIYVNVTENEDGTFSADKTVKELIELYNSGCAIFAVLVIDDVLPTIHSLDYVHTDEDESWNIVGFLTTIDEGKNFSFIQIGSDEVYVYQEPNTNAKLTISVDDNTYEYDGTEEKSINIPTPIIPTKLPNPKALKIDDKTYDGTEEINFTDIIDQLIQNRVPTKLPNALPLLINKKAYYGSALVDYTDTINQMIDEKSKDFETEPFKPSVINYGAKGDGTTDDTAAFQAALAENRLVYVPEGTYKLSGTLVVRGNCEFELSQATHLKFTQTEGNCIELRSSATLRGNHAVIEVPYAFTGNVISVDTQFDEGTTDTPPFGHYDPMWKRARYIYDVCIVKPNQYRLHESVEGENFGTGIYLSAKGKHLTEGDINFIWGAMLQGIRIAGAFTYGIQVENIDNPDDTMEDDAWNHDMRIEAVIQGCETGVSLFNCNLVRLAVTIQPSTASKYLGVDENGKELYKYTKYAKWGVRLEDCKNIDMSSSFIWDWQVARDYDDEVKGESKEEYTRIAMYGNCPGLIVSDYLYHSNGIDIRKNTYTDRPSNLDKMTVLQEPITRWFKPVDNLPYFSNGKESKQLLLKEEFDICFQTDNVSNFTDELARATDLNGNIYNGIGYEVGVGYIASNGMDMDSEYYGRTGFIKCKPNSTGNIIVNVEGIKITPDDGWSGVLLYTKDKTLRDGGWVSSYNLLNNTKYYYTDNYTETENGFTFRIVALDVEYIRFTTKKGEFGTSPVVAINEEISYSQAGFLADSVKVKAKNVIGLPSGGGSSVQSDLSQNDETQPDYVKNRTHWSEYEEVKLVDNVTIAPNDFIDNGDGSFKLELITGQEYKVTANGEESTEIAQLNNSEGQEIIYIGNPAAFGSSDDNGKAFFAGYLPADGISLVGSAIAEDLTITIETMQEIVHTIPKKYIPPIAYVITARNFVSGGTDEEDTFTVSETAEELKNILLSNGTLTLRAVTDSGMISDYRFLVAAYVGEIYALEFDRIIGGKQEIAGIVYGTDGSVRCSVRKLELTA